MPTAAKPNATTSAAGQRQQRPRRREQAEAAHDREERHGVHPAPHQRPGDLAERDVDRPEWRGQHRVVEAVVLELEEHVVGGVEHRAVHRRRGQQTGRDEGGVRDRDAVRPGQRADQRAEPLPHRDQVEHRLEDPGHDRQPGAPRRRRRPPHQRPRPAGVAARRQQPGEHAAAAVGRRPHGAGILLAHRYNLRRKRAAATAEPADHQRHEDRRVARARAAPPHRRAWRCRGRRAGELGAVPQRRQPR